MATIVWDETVIPTYTTKEDDVDLVEADHMNQVQIDLKGLKTEIGATVRGSATNLVTRLARSLANNGAFAQGVSFPISPTPIDGQPFFRTDEKTFYIYNAATTNWDTQGSGGIEIFTSSGTFTAPGGVSKVYLSMIGGGGNGAAGGNSGNGIGAGGGGSAGQMIQNYPFTVVAGNNYTTTIGGAGESTSFDSVSVAGGNGGSGGSSGSTGGAGGAAKSPDAPAAPTGGLMCIATGSGASASGQQYGGGGGGTSFGAGGNGGNSSVGAAGGANTGAGGGGGPSKVGSGYAGGSGGSGICIVMY